VEEKMVSAHPVLVLVVSNENEIKESLIHKFGESVVDTVNFQKEGVLDWRKLFKNEKVKEKI
jgi:hypothetical protein